ncbi:MAG: hypothetical protein A2V88_04950 [Elusimicrobia bacterium RBG_16_66_12]|nr:MAG: hypothetical protein A2V88_04950 [Elusimicrobia bacterium RBG_16_66_12]
MTKTELHLEAERVAKEWQATFDSTRDAIFILDEDQRITRCNKAAGQILQRPCKELIGIRCWEMMHGTEEPIPPCPFVRMRQSPQRETMELLIGERLFEVTVDPILDADDGRLVGAVHVLSDITERKRAEEALRKKSEDLAALLEITSALAPFHETETLLQRIVDSAVQFLQSGSGAIYLLEDGHLVLKATFPPLPPGFPEELRRARVADHPHIGLALSIMSPQILADAQTADLTPAERNVVDMRGLRSLLYLPLHRMDSTLGVLIVGTVDSPHEFSAEEVAVYRTLANQAAIEIEEAHRFEQKQRDLAELERQVQVREQTEKALREERDRFTRIVAAVPGAICLFRRNPDGFARFTYASPAIEDIYGLSPEELERDASAVRERIHPDDLAQVAAQIAESAQTLLPWRGEFRFAHPQKGEVWIETRFIPSREADGSTVWSGIVLDVSDRKQAERERDTIQGQLYQAQKVESIGRLAGGVAHDFNNQLSIILGYADNVLNHLHNADPLREDVQQILEAAKRSAKLTHQLLAFSRKQTLQPEAIDLNALVDNLKGMLQRLVGEDTDLELRLSGDLAPVMADPNQMEHIIMNLVVNARDAMPSGGKLTIETMNTELDETSLSAQRGAEPGDYVMLAVTDTGCGMDEQVLMHIFEPFFTTKGRGKGTGLGLSTVEGIVKQSGGYVWADSRPGQGASFRILLPRTQAEPRVRLDQVPAGERTQHGRQHILLVEDESSLRGLLERVLATLGYLVTSAANGGEALLLVEEGGLEPDLVVSDVVMPGVDGPTLAARLRHRLPGLKTLYMSGYPDDLIIPDVVLGTDSAFIQKPVDMSVLAAKLREILEGSL